MEIPSREQALELLQKHDVPENIVGHSKQVAKVATFLAEKIKEQGEQVNVPLVDAAALLHDIGKHIGLNTGKSHADEGAKILEKEGLPEIAKIAEEHRLHYILETPLSSLESKIVYYADKRVRYDKVVSLGERFDYLLERYGSIKPRFRETILKCRPLVEELEKELFGKAKTGVSLEELR